MIDENAESVDSLGEPVEVPAQGVGQRLGFVMVKEARVIAPARIAPQFDEPGPEHHAEEQPAQEDESKEGRRRVGRAQEDGEKPGFEQNGLPPEGVEDLPYI